MEATQGLEITKPILNEALASGEKKSNEVWETECLPEALGDFKIRFQEGLEYIDERNTEYTDIRKQLELDPWEEDLESGENNFTVILEEFFSSTEGLPYFAGQVAGSWVEFSQDFITEVINNSDDVFIEEAFREYAEYFNLLEDEYEDTTFEKLLTFYTMEEKQEKLIEDLHTFIENAVDEDTIEQLLQDKFKKEVEKIYSSETEPEVDPRQLSLDFERRLNMLHNTQNKHDLRFDRSGKFHKGTSGFGNDSMARIANFGKQKQGKKDLEEVMSRQADYQGWANYATWGVALVIDNDRDEHEYWREQAAGVRQEQNAVHFLADELKEYYEESTPNLDGVYDAIFRAGFEDVNWEEIAEKFLEE